MARSIYAKRSEGGEKAPYLPYTPERPHSHCRAGQPGYG
jgi:hypothetical protein